MTETDNTGDDCREEMERRHHEFSPSKLGRLAICPGSHKLSSGMPSTAGPGATRGQRLHEATASRSGAAMSALSPFDRRLVEDAISYVDGIATRYGYHEVGRMTEDHYDLRSASGTVITSGTADVVVLVARQPDAEPTGAIVVDWKFHPNGEIPPAIADWQLRAYCLMALQRWPEIKGALGLAYAPAGPTEIEVRVSREKDAKDTCKEILSVISEAQSPSAPIIPHVQACRYCPAASVCGVLAARSTLLPAEAADLGAVVRSTDDGYELLDPTRFADLIDQAKSAKAFATQFLDRAKEVLAQCEHPTLVLRPGAQRRKIGDHGEVLKRLPQDIRYALEASCVSKWSIGDLERAIREVDGIGAAAAKTRAEELVGEQLIVAASSPTIQKRRNKE